MYENNLPILPERLSDASEGRGRPLYWKASFQKTSVNRRNFCIKTWNADEFVHLPGARRTSLIRKTGKLEEKYRKEAQYVTISRLKAIRSEHGSDGSGFLAGLDGRTRTIAINTSSVAEERMSISHVDCKG